MAHTHKNNAEKIIWEMERQPIWHNTYPPHHEHINSHSVFQGSLKECFTDISESTHLHQTDLQFLHSMLGNDTT